MIHITPMTNIISKKQKLYQQNNILKVVKAQSMVDALSELCFPFLKGGNSTSSVVITSGIFSK